MEPEPDDHLGQECPKFLPGGPNVVKLISEGLHLTTILTPGRILFIL